ncbi:MAG TPA: tetratricopeptide repeat protein, partial [Phycisphaerales bacterium]|nr:tetratricopeptide repeat protein [Phycisphaerales bacterium]
RDAQEDLRAALRLDPAFEPARRLLVDSLVAGGQFDVAVQELRKLLVDHPENGDVRAQLLTVLALRGRTDDLIGELRAAVQREPESVRWLTSLGSTLVRAGRAREAVPHLAKAWEVESSPLIAGVYVTGLLALSPPDHARALEVLASEKIATEKDPGLLLFRAHALATAGRAAEARADVVRAYSMVPADDPSSVQGFFAGLAAIAPKPADVLALMEQIKPAGGHPGWFDYWLAMGLQGDPATRGRALEMLGAIAEGPDQVKAFAAHRVLGALAYQDKRHEEAVAHFRKALEARPGDPEVSNNLAYALAVDLHKPEEALQHAERAAALMRTNASVLDTLGVVYLELGRTDEAAGTFMRGLSMAVTPQEKASLYYGMARAKLRAGDRVEAKRYADQLEAQVKTTPGLLTTFESRLGSLRADLSGQ